MKKFANIRDGLNFKNICPFCNSQLITDCFSKLFNNCLFFEDIDGSIHVDIDSGNIVYNSMQNYLHIKYGRNIYMACKNCHAFYYVLQIWIDCDKNIACDIILNSETVFWWIDNQNMVTIKNIHSSNKTKYIETYMEAAVNKKTTSVEIPLIEIDYNNINNIIDKIKKLIIYC